MKSRDQKLHFFLIIKIGSAFAGPIFLCLWENRIMNKVPITLWVSDLEISNEIYKVAKERAIKAVPGEVDKSVNKPIASITENKTHAFVEEWAKSINNEKSVSKENNVKNEFLELLKSKLEK